MWMQQAPLPSDDGNAAGGSVSPPPSPPQGGGAASDDAETLRVIKHFQKATSGRWRASLDLLAGAGKGSAPNYALLLHSCLVLSLSTYNLKVRPEPYLGPYLGPLSVLI